MEASRNNLYPWFTLAKKGKIKKAQQENTKKGKHYDLLR